MVTQSFTVMGHFSDGSQKALSPEGWAVNLPLVGGIDGKGLYTPSTLAGGGVTITAKYQENKGSATLNVKLHYSQKPGNVPAGT